MFASGFMPQNGRLKRGTAMKPIRLRKNRQPGCSGGEWPEWSRTKDLYANSATESRARIATHREWNGQLLTRNSVGADTRHDRTAAQDEATIAVPLRAPPQATRRASRRAPKRPSNSLRAASGTSEQSLSTRVQNATEPRSGTPRSTALSRSLRL